MKANLHIIINIAQQTLIIYDNHTILHKYCISTAKNGIGGQQDSGCTPLGEHIIAQMIGEDEPISTVFVGRVPTGEIYDDELGSNFPKRDWILSRILWLAGLEEGINKGNNQNGGCDSYQRYIYIHGTPDTEAIGKPLSHGCIRMRNDDIIELFEKVDTGTRVFINR